MASKDRAPTRDLELGARIATAPLRDATARHHHHARSAVAAVGLERQPPVRPERLPSDRPGPCDPGGLCRVVVHVHSITPHPVARCEPGAASSKAAGSPRAIRAPAHRLAAVRTQAALARPPGLVPRERCASPTSATDSLHEHPADCCVSGCASAPLPALRRAAMRRAHAHPGPWPSGARSWGDLTDRIPGEQPDGALA